LLTTGSIFKAWVTGYVDLFLLPWYTYQWLQLPTAKEKMNVLLLVGNSSELLCVLVALLSIVIAGGLIWPFLLTRTVSALESFNGRIGQVACWFALIMALQQVMIIVTGQIFRGNEIIFAPFGVKFAGPQLQWLSGQLKLYNAILIALASAYTFIEGGHVRVDLIYTRLSEKGKKISDLVCTLIFLLPSSVLLWWFAWPLATNSMFAQRPLNIWSTKAGWRGFRWEASGTAEFSWVWTFKFLILVFAGLMFIQACTFVLRNLMALRLDPSMESHPRFDPLPASPEVTQSPDVRSREPAQQPTQRTEGF